MSTRDNFLGLVGIKDKKVIVKDPINNEREAVIVPGKNVTVMVDNQVIDNETRVNSKNIIKVSPKMVAPVRDISINIAKDKMSVSIQITYQKGRQYIIEDMDFRNRLVIDSLSYEDINKPFNVQEIILFLNEQKIIYGIDEEAIQKAIDTGEKTIVAKGKNYIMGKDGWIENLIKLDDKKSIPKEGSIIRDRDINMVKENQKIAKVHPPQKGKPGINVYGEEVLPPKPKEIKIISGPGTNLIDNELLVSTIEGRLDKVRNKYSVYHVYQVNEDVNPKNGYIKFNGDVIIKGNVLDGMKIESKGKIEVFGYAANSTLLAGGDVIVHHNMVGCIVKAGGADLIYKKAKETLECLEINLKELIESAKRLKDSLIDRKQVKSDCAIVNALLDQKFSDLPNDIFSALKNLYEVEEIMEQEKLNKNNLLKVIDHIKSWHAKLSGFGPLQISRIADLEYKLAVTFSDARKLLTELKLSYSQGVIVKSPYIQNCNIQSDGDVIIDGKGCYNSKILANGNIEIKGSPGVFRGGSITAKGYVKAEEIGSVAEIPTFIQVDKSKYIKASIVYPGTILKSGPKMEKITEKESSVYFTSSSN